MRFTAITVAVLCISLSLPGIFGVWWIERRANDRALKAIGLIESASAAVHTGVSRVDELIAASRTEIQHDGGQCTAGGAA